VRFLIDNALSQALSDELRTAGHDSVHVREYGLQRAEDDVVLERARAESRILVSADTDFGRLHALRKSMSPSVILFRHPIRHASAQSALILANLMAIERDLDAGSIAVIEGDRVRIRKLPIVDDET